MSEDQINRVRREFGRYVAGPQFEADFVRTHPQRGWLLVAVILFALMLRLRTAWDVFTGARRREYASARLRREYQRLAEVGVPLVAFAARRNVSLRESPDVVAPALVVGSFDPAQTEDEIRSLALIAASADIMADSPAEEELGRMLGDEEYVSRRRRVFPHELTDGREVVAFDMLLTGAHVSGQYAAPRIFCLADERPGGLMVALPINLLAPCGLAGPEMETKAGRASRSNPFLA